MFRVRYPHTPRVALKHIHPTLPLPPHPAPPFCLKDLFTITAQLSWATRRDIDLFVHLRVADPHHFDSDPGLAFHCNADPVLDAVPLLNFEPESLKLLIDFYADPDPTFHFNADSIPAFHSNADPDPD